MTRTPIKTEDSFELDLARAVREFDRELQPERDLWPGIERRIAKIPLKRAGLLQIIMPVAMAASFLMAAASLWLVLDGDELVSPVSLQQSLNQIDNDFLKVRNPLLREFERRHPQLDETTLRLVYKNVEVIEKARQEIEVALIRNPEDQTLLEMLMRVRQSEIELLNHSYSITEQPI